MVGGLAPPAAEEEQRREAEAGQGVVFVLEGAQLEVAQVGKARGLATFAAAPRAAARTPPQRCGGPRRRPVPVSTPCLPVAPKLAQSYQLLNCDDHATYLKKHKRDPSLHRPDITHQVGARGARACPNKGCPAPLPAALAVHVLPAAARPRRPHRWCVARATPSAVQALLMMLDSPLNKAGKLKARAALRPAHARRRSTTPPAAASNTRVRLRRATVG